ncbi:sigma factor [Streptomyces sp. NPDC002701]|uniref:sigma factor n=1 Tax=Streptomyces sp. NPDC002701 TaxID=3364661 RepID=UPI0036C47FDD
MSESQAPATDRVSTTATRLFMDHRELLFAIVYNLLGSVADTEDVLQETWFTHVLPVETARKEADA